MNEQQTALVNGTNGGLHIADGPITTGAIAEASDSLLRTEADSRIVRIRPMSTPVDQISRMIGARRVGSMQVDYYSVDTKPAKATAQTDSTASSSDSYEGRHVVALNTSDDSIFAISETILVPSVTVTDANGGKSPLMLYVIDSGINADGIRAIAVNSMTAPSIKAGAELIRMGRAASELDVQTAQFGALPHKDFNYCQIFKAQIEQSLYAKISAKEVGWSFSDQEEVAIMDMRTGMEKSFLFGTKSRLSNPANFDDTLFTEGIWNQASTVHQLDAGDFSEKSLVALMRTAFTGEAAGSPRKILIAGAGLIEKLNCLSYVRNVGPHDKVTHWGIDFTEIASKFGSLYVIYSEIFDQCGHADDGLVVDPSYITKYVHVPFRVDEIDMKKNGTRNTQALVATEASCLVLRHPKAHVKVLGNAE